MAVESPRGSTAFWWVPVAVADRLVGFFVFDTAQKLERYSSFLSHPGEVDRGPLAKSWTNPVAISERALQAAGGGRATSVPYLTYDGSPARITWAVDVIGPTGAKTVYVAGDYVYSR